MACCCPKNKCSLGKIVPNFVFSKLVQKQDFKKKTIFRYRNISDTETLLDNILTRISCPRTTSRIEIFSLNSLIKLSQKYFYCKKYLQFKYLNLWFIHITVILDTLLLP